MGKSFRFLLSFVWVNISAVLGFAAVVIAGCYATGVPGRAGVSNLFVTYFSMYPIMILFMLYVYAFALCTTNLDLGLSFGARRRDFFWALQGIMAVYVLASWALQLFLCALPSMAGWRGRDRWEMLHIFDGRPWMFPLACAMFLVLGCLSGLVLIKRKGLGIFLITLSVLVLMAATVILILSAEVGLEDFLLESGWGWLIAASKIVIGLLAAAAVGGEFLIWRVIQRHVVR